MRARGKAQHAAALYASAAEAFDTQEVAGYAAAARIRHAELVDEDSASAARAQAHLYFVNQGIVDPARWTGTFAPAPRPDLSRSGSHSIHRV
jgi:hypothetical protein